MKNGETSVSLITVVIKAFGTDFHSAISSGEKTIISFAIKRPARTFL